MVLARLRSTNEKRLLGKEHKNHMSRKTGAKSFQVKNNVERDLQIAFFRFPKWSYYTRAISQGTTKICMPAPDKTWHSGKSRWNLKIEEGFLVPTFFVVMEAEKLRKLFKQVQRMFSFSSGFPGGRSQTQWSKYKVGISVVLQVLIMRLYFIIRFLNCQLNPCVNSFFIQSSFAVPNWFTIFLTDICNHTSQWFGMYDCICVLFFAECFFLFAQIVE